MMKGTVVRKPYWVSVNPKSGTIKLEKLAISCLSTKLSKLRSVRKNNSLYAFNEIPF